MNQVDTVLGGLKDVIVVADALHAQTAHARDLNARGAALLVTVKANHPTVHQQLKSILWRDVPVGNRTRECGHHRRETRTLKAVTLATATDCSSPTPPRPYGSPAPASSKARPPAKPRT